MEQSQLAGQVETVVRELIQIGNIQPGQIVVFGVSTSEVTGRQIGSSGSMAAARAIYDGIHRVRMDAGFFTAFQCCEHLNRALVVERALADLCREEPVSAVPIPTAGGSMAAYAYAQMDSPCLIESIRAHAGVDIGDTLIGMHLRPVAVPVRPSMQTIGQAHVTMAYTRPKLIGGSRAVYTPDPAIGQAGAPEQTHDSGSCG